MTKTDLYRHFDINGRLLYVGISLNSLARLQQHKSKSDWFDDIYQVTIQKFDSRADADLAERNAIVYELPIHNKTFSTKHLLFEECEAEEICVETPRGKAPQKLDINGKRNGRAIGLISNAPVPADFPAPEHLRFKEEDGGISRSLRVCWPGDFLHVHGVPLDPYFIDEVKSSGVNVVIHKLL